MASAERQRLLRFGWSGARYALGPIGGLLLPWLVIHRGSADLWGEMQTPLICLQIIVHISAWGSKDFLLQAFARDGKRQDDLLGGSVSTRGMLLILSMLAIGVSGRESLTAVIPAAFMMFMSASLEPIIVWHKRFVQATAADLFGLAAQIIYLASQERIDASSIFSSIYLNQCIRVVLVVLLNWSVIPFGMERWDIRTHILSAFPFFLIGFSGLLATRIDLYTMNVLVDRAQMGVYQVVTAFFTQFQVLPGLIVLPMTRELYRLDRSSVRRGAKRLFRLGLLLTLPMLFAAWVLFTLVFHFDLHWSVYLAGALATLPAYGYSPCITHLFKRHRERAVVIACFASAASTLLLTVLLAPRLGFAGALFASAAGQWLLFVMVLHTLERDAQP